MTIRYGLDELPLRPPQPTPVEAGIPADAPLALAVGRLIEQKDHATLLRAFARVRETLPDARLAILGGGPLEAETRALAAELGLADAVVAPGPHRDPRLARARGRLRPHVALGGLRNRPARGDAGRAADRRDARQRRAGGRRGRRDRRARPGGRRRRRRARARRAARETRACAARLGEAGRERARTEFSVARMAERTLDVYREAARAARARRRPAASQRPARAPRARQRRGRSARSRSRRARSSRPRSARARAACPRRVPRATRTSGIAVAAAGSTGRSMARREVHDRDPRRRRRQGGNDVAQAPPRRRSASRAPHPRARTPRGTRPRGRRSAAVPAISVRAISLLTGARDQVFVSR